MTITQEVKDKQNLITDLYMQGYGMYAIAEMLFDHGSKKYLQRLISAALKDAGIQIRTQPEIWADIREGRGQWQYGGIRRDGYRYASGEAKKAAALKIPREARRKRAKAGKAAQVRNQRV